MTMKQCEQGKKSEPRKIVRRGLEAYSANGSAPFDVQITIAVVIALTAILGFGGLCTAVQLDTKLIRSKVIIANNLELRGSDGKLVAFLTGRSQGDGILSLIGKKNQRLFLSAENGFPRMVMTGTAPIVLSLEVLPPNSPRFSIAGGNYPGFELADYSDRPPSFTMGGWNGTGATLIEGSFADGDNSNICLVGRRERKLVRLMSNKDGTAVSLLDQNGSVKTAVGIAPGVAPEFNFYDSQSESRLRFTEDVRGTALIKLFDPKNNRIELIQ